MVSEASWAGTPAWPEQAQVVSPLDTQQQAWAAAAQAERAGPRRTNRSPAMVLNISVARNQAQSRLWFRERAILTEG